MFRAVRPLRFASLCAASSRVSPSLAFGAVSSAFVVATLPLFGCSAVQGPGTSSDGASQSMSAGTASPSVGNPDPGGVDAQPDWDELARDTRDLIDPKLPKPLPTDAGKACDEMFAAADAYYARADVDEEERTRMAKQLAESRVADRAACIEDTSVAAATCTKILLEEAAQEFPFILDQCSRAYPKAAGAVADDGSGTKQPEASGAGASPAASDAGSLELTFVGDVIFGRYRDDGFDEIPEDGYDPFADIKETLAADVVVGNLETPVVEEVPVKSPIGSKYRFAAGRRHVQLLAKNGFRVMSLANNHFFDLREEGQRESPRILAEEGILPIGASRTEEPWIRVESLDVKGWKVGFIALTTRRNAPQFKDAPVLPYLELRKIPEIVKPLLDEARASHDLLVVFVHWGDEYAEQPDIYTQKVARALIDAGANAVIGHHPHVLQAVEHHAGGVIAYSMGNFLFENTNEIPRLTGVLRLRFTRASQKAACLERAVFHSAVITRLPSKHPVPATGALGKRVRGRVISQAAALGTTWTAIAGSEDLELGGLTNCP